MSSQEKKHTLLKAIGLTAAAGAAAARYQFLYVPAGGLSGGCLPGRSGGVRILRVQPVCHLFPAADRRSDRPAQ